MELKTVLKGGLFLLLLAVTACVPFQQSTGMPLPPYGDAWTLEIRDLKGKVTLKEQFSRGSQFQRFTVATPTSVSGSISTYVGDAIKEFRSGNLVLPKFSLYYAGDVVEIKSVNFIGVAFFVNPASKTSDIQSLYIYPDNRQGIYDQIGCRFDKVQADAKELSGLAFLAEPSPNQLPLKSSMPTSFPQKGTCTLIKLETLPAMK